MADHNYFANLIWQIADLLRGPYRPPQYERVMLPMTVLRRFDCVLAPTKAKVLTEFDRRKGGKLQGDALDTHLNNAAGQRAAKLYVYGKDYIERAFAPAASDPLMNQVGHNGAGNNGRFGDSFTEDQFAESPPR
jgi:type I restriction-modification system DNA methylase subunit